MTKQEVQFHFIKSPDYKEVLVDGAFGGISAVGRIVAAVYSERPFIPKSVVYEIDGNVLGKELPEMRESKDGLIRSIGAILYFDRASAVAMRDWLTQKIEELDALTATVKEK